MIAIRGVEDRLGVGYLFYVRNADAENFFVYIVHLDTVLGYSSICAVVVGVCLFFMCVTCCQGESRMTR